MSQEVNRERVRLWVEALRSGDYTQGTGALRVKVGGGDQFCCLGVACEVARANGLDLEVTRGDTQEGEIGIRYGYQTEDGWPETSFLLPKVAGWLGLDTYNPVFSGKAATEWNDDYKRSFEEIADLIEREYLKEGEE